MDEIENLEEPPPIHRYVAPVEKRHKPGVFAAWSGRPAASRSPDFGPAANTGSNTAVVLVVASVVILSVQVWILHGLHSMRADLADVRSELKETRSSLKETRSSLGVVWQATQRLGEDRTERLGALADSLRGVLERAEGAARLWQASYDSLGQRFADSDKAIRTMTSGMRSVYTRLESQRSRLDALERSDRTHTSAIEALSRTR
jgi:hypothetical protein